MPGKQEISHCDNASLIALAQKGDSDAMERLISQNMGLVKNIAKRFIGRGAEFEDHHPHGFENRGDASGG